MIKKLAISQAFILVVSVFAFAYLIAEVDRVSAIDSFTKCCPLTNGGDVCEDVFMGYAECSEDLIDTKCSSTSQCKIGCCIDEEIGLCTEMSRKQKCELDGGEWEEDSACNVLDCQRGCCMIGSQAVFTTERNCEFLSSTKGGGIEADFRPDIDTQLECLILSGTQEVGACVLSNGNCNFGTQADCMNRNGIFSKDTLCSHPDLETNCEKQVSVGCVEGKDEIYWYDSCGNRENIYSANEDDSWNGGDVLSKEESCGVGSANINSETCGNCNHYLGSKCAVADEKKIEDGDFICEDLTCYDTYDGTDRQNGESWCVYDSSIGGGTDAVGSRHWLHMCVDGEEIVEGCADFRQQVCVEVSEEVGGGKISNAGCVLNEWRNCYDYNNEARGKMLDLCGKNKHCFVQTVWHPGAKVAAEPVQVCLPSYSPGFDFYNTETAFVDLCGYASQDIDVVKVKKCKVAGLFGSKWVYVANEVAKTDSWTQAMNKWCTSIGDCGAYVNYNGEVTTGGYGVSGLAQKLSQTYLNGLKSFSVPNPEVKGEMSGVGNEIPEGATDLEWTNVLGMAGMAMSYGTVAGWVSGGIAKLPIGLQNVLASGPVQALGAIAAAYAIGNLVGQMIGLNKEDSEALGYVGAGAAAGYAAIAAYTTYAATFAAPATELAAMEAFYVTTGPGIGPLLPGFGPMIFWAVVAIIVVAVISKLAGCGKKVEEPAGFSCKAWEPPAGGESCEVCNEDDVHECSVYRCKSLGAACEFVNEDTSNAECIWNDRYNTSPPVISPWQESLTSNYSFESLGSCPTSCTNKIKSSTSSQCLEAYQSIVIGLQTDEHAKCNYDFKEKDFEDMEGSFNGGLYSKNFSTIIMAPGVQTLEAELERLREQFEDTTAEDFGEGYEYFQEILNTPVEDTVRLYVKCQNVNGYSNIAPMVIEMCLDPEPDITAPYITSINPKNEGIIKNGVVEQNVTMYTNEPAECKYSLSDRGYSEMENTFECINELTSGTVWGWVCSTTLTNIQDENTLYVKCKDKPNSAEADRYTNTESYVYSFSRSVTPLTISSILPQGQVDAGFEPITVDIEVKTSGGAENGKSICYWGQQLSTPFLDSNSNIHVQSLIDRMEGNYNIPIECRDSAGNIVSDTASFSLKVDSEPPQVIRAYSSGGRLKLVTDEKADCYYDLSKCNFNMNNGTSMTTGFSTSHDAEWLNGKTYYIKCEDIWGNKNPNCAIKITPSVIG